MVMQDAMHHKTFRHMYLNFVSAKYGKKEVSSLISTQAMPRHLRNIHERNIHANGRQYESKDDFWNTIVASSKDILSMWSSQDFDDMNRLKIIFLRLNCA